MSVKKRRRCQAGRKPDVAPFLGCHLNALDVIDLRCGMFFLLVVTGRFFCWRDECRRILLDEILHAQRSLPR